MSKYNRNRRVARRGKTARLHRRWLKNVGDGGRMTREGKNANDMVGRLVEIGR